MDLDIENIKKEFAKNLASVRKKKKLTQDTLGIKCGFADGSQISQWERGLYDLQLSRIILLAKALEVDPKELLNFTI
ncbi:helix-turn-helix domain-containing protein [Mucilaginibacter sp. P25]|uniref:Helix-turn-helix domain-containing protein n=1 Tax=Mucilaginibacter gossypiicola TaxID=551995 RepID=A0A1H8AXW3_9SPHI|nr:MULTISPECIES: helix-turn-helix transcriptional regulator [Mucilaginibacter]UOE52236.1 helix-turn-helix domain-containing protein [Mucilaginibacter sp. SMC90]SEM74689.1 Helix-turn-helix domain-containing protein [Mucilaginibacter gossypiicola]